MSAQKSLDGYCVLLVEDCPDQQRLYAHFLQRAGADVAFECNGDAAVKLVSRSSATKPIDVVVIDLQIPVLDGIESTRQLRSDGFDGVVIAITAHGSKLRQRLWFEAGCDAYFEKPFDARTLVEAVQEGLMSRGLSGPNAFSRSACQPS